MIVRSSVYRDMLKSVRCIEKHRRVQLYVSILTIFAGTVSLFFPEHGYAAAIAGVATNFIWVWE